MDCSKLVIYFDFDFIYKLLFGFSVIDASGRFFSTGFFTGTITDLGSFDQCLNIQAPDLVDNKHILGQYCIAKYNMPLPPRPNHLTLKTKIFDFSNTSLDGTVSFDFLN